MNKYQVTIQFEMDNEFMSFVPDHRTYVNKLIDKNIIDYYSVSMESQRTWIVINAINKKSVMSYLADSPLYKYWEVEIDELFVYDGQTFRLPALQLN